MMDLGNEFLLSVLKVPRYNVLSSKQVPTVQSQTIQAYL